MNTVDVAGAECMIVCGNGPTGEAFMVILVNFQGCSSCQILIKQLGLKHQSTSMWLNKPKCSLLHVRALEQTV